MIEEADLLARAVLSPHRDRSRATAHAANGACPTYFLRRGGTFYRRHKHTLAHSLSLSSSLAIQLYWPGDPHFVATVKFLGEKANRSTKPLRNQQ